MADYQQGTIEILEIYHARRIRTELLSNLKRLGTLNPLDPDRDPARRRALRVYYEALYFTVDELLEGLGDTQSPA